MADRRAEEEMKRRQDSHLDGQQHLQQPPIPPQKCPRCDSLITKFCYYNNYSLSQPRYFCKTCRRYWTQGGTLRNVPVGGGSRKARRTKASSSTSSSSSGAGDSSRSKPQLQHQQVLQLNKDQQGNLGMASSGSNVINPVNSYYSQAGFLPSLAAVQSSGKNQIFNQVINNALGNDHHDQCGSNLGGLLQGLNAPSFRLQQPQIPVDDLHLRPQSHEFYQMGNQDKNTDQQIYPSFNHNQNMVQTTSRNPIMNSWTQSFINNHDQSNTTPLGTNVNFWSSCSTTGNSTTDSSAAEGSSKPCQWSDHLPSYGPP